MERFWKGVAIVAVLLMVLVIGYTLVLAQEPDEGETPAIPETDENTHFGFGWRGGKFLGRGSVDGDRMMPEALGDWNSRGSMIRGRTLSLEVVAEALNMTVEEVRTELVEGISIADLADTQGVDVQIIIESVLAQQEEAMAFAVENDRISQERADEMLADLAERISEQVNTPWARPMREGFRPDMNDFDRGLHIPHISWLETIADELELSVEELQSNLAEGSSLADLATENGVELQEIIDALLNEHQTALNTAVEEGSLTQEQADAMQINMAERITSMLENGWHAGPGSMPRGRGGRGMWLKDGTCPHFPEGLDTETSTNT